MYDTIVVSGPEVVTERFEKGIAIEVHGEELSIYPVNLTMEEFNSIVASLGQVEA